MILSSTRFMKFVFFGLLMVGCLSSCAGYRLGGSRPAAMNGVQSIAVPMFHNETQHPRAEALATSAVADSLVQDGTYRIGSIEGADAILEGRVSRIEYSTLRGSRLNPQLPEELTNTVTLKWTVRDARDPLKVLAVGSSEGKSQLFRDSNLQTARNNALDDALERAAETLVSRIANGF